MFDELQRLRDHRELFQLLSHYAGSEDRECWLDRVMQFADVEPRNLIRLHGELLAHGWLEPNTGEARPAQAGACPRCYRATTAGRRALRHAAADTDAAAA